MANNKTEYLKNMSLHTSGISNFIYNINQINVGSVGAVEQKMKLFGELVCSIEQYEGIRKVKVKRNNLP